MVVDGCCEDDGDGDKIFLLGLLGDVFGPLFDELVEEDGVFSDANNSVMNEI